MSLATRCTSCGTIFRVVQDQLKVSEGWVRCGRCQQVFNALQSLFDLEREAPPPWAPAPGWDQTQPVDPALAAAANAAAAAPPPSPAQYSAAVSAPAAPAAAVPPTARAPSQPEVERGSDVPLPERTVPQPQIAQQPLSTQPLLRAQSREEPPPPPPPSFAADGHEDFADARFNPDLIDEDDLAMVGVTAEVPMAPPPAAPPPVPSAPPPAPTPRPAAPKPAVPRAVPARERSAAPRPAPATLDAPRFVQEAERAARWQSPPVRAALSLLGLLLGLLLLVQLALHFRSPLAAQWPGTRPVLAQLCEWARCTIEPPRLLDQLAVSSTSLTRGERAGEYRLSVSLHNSAAVPVLLPALELSLTDGQGQLIARKALLPQQLSGAQRSVPAQGEATLHALLVAGGQRVVGYSVEIFYP